MHTTQETWNCPDCGLEVIEPRRRGPHLSACRRSAKAKYRYLDGDNKHPYEFKTCAECGVESWIQVRRDYCSYSCSKMGEKNPARQKWSGQTITVNEYHAAHRAVKRARGRAFGCAHCGTTEDRMYHWANISGNYWDVNDYINLCVPCHDKYDRAKGRIIWDN